MFTDWKPFFFLKTNASVKKLNFKVYYAKSLRRAHANACDWIFCAALPKLSSNFESKSGKIIKIKRAKLSS